MNLFHSWFTSEITTSVIMAYTVNILQLSIKYRWYYSVCKSISAIFKIFFLKKLCRINYIKLYIIIVKKSIKQIKLYKILKIKLHNIHQNIYYNFRVFPKRYWIRTMAEPEEDGHSRDHTPKKERTRTTHLWFNFHDYLQRCL
jgi:hypothetical protein